MPLPGDFGRRSIGLPRHTAKSFEMDPEGSLFHRAYGSMCDERSRGEQLRELGVENCPLIPGGDENKRPLVALHNRVLELLHLVSDAAPDEIRTRRLAPLRSDLWNAHSRLARLRYQVGLIGPFQVGKSTTFNKVLKDDKLAPVGKGKAMTAAVTRMCPLTEQERGDDAKHWLEVRYLTEEEYAKKRAFLCQMTNLDVGLPDSTLLTEIPKRLAEVERGTNIRVDGSENEIVKPMDLEYLALLLNSKKRHGERIGPTRRIEEVGYHARDRYLSHPPGSWVKTPGAYPPLLADVIVHFNTDVVPQALEMIDLPGLGSRSSVDQYLTERFIRDLDGALVFCDPTKLDSDDVQRILLRLNEAWRGHFEKRLWLVYTYCDSLGPQHLKPDKGDTTFHAIRDFMEQQRIPLNQLCLVTNSPGKLEWDEDDPQIIKTLNDRGMEGLRSAWHELYQNGGINAVRRLIADELAEQVGLSVMQFCRQELGRIGRDLWHLASAGFGLGPVDTGQIATATRSINRLNRVISHLTNGPRWLSDPAEDLKTNLNETFDDLAVDPHTIDSQSAEQCWEDCVQRTVALENALRDQMRLSITSAAYEEVLPDLHELEEQQLVTLNGIFPGGLAAAWEGYRQQDEDSLGWLGDDFPSFIRNRPCEHMPPNANRPFSGMECIDMMRQKIDVVSQQVAQCLRNRLRERLKEMVGQLRGFARLPDDLQEMQGPLRELRRRMEEFEDFSELGGNGE